MTDPNADNANPIGIEGLEMLPTGSGVQDLEIAREQAALADGIADADAVGTADELTPTEDDGAIEETIAQPS